MEGAGRVSPICRGPAKVSPQKGWSELGKFRASGRAPLPARGGAADFVTTAVFWTMRP